MQTFEEKFKALKAEAAKLGITTRELARRRHIEALKFAQTNGSEYAHIAIAELERQRY